ncbi:MAG: site-specific DNA-methyltransferase, partial [Planctomycetes bacterium]|nr:site-specific DNA-methyltransferase [Planctomycetota bacterium]
MAKVGCGVRRSAICHASSCELLAGRCGLRFGPYDVPCPRIVTDRVHGGLAVAVDLNRIIRGDCITKLAELEAGSVDLAFADPPFNIGYDYDEYDDKRTCKDYLDWSRRWISEVIRVLKPDGTFWLAIGDEYAAELKVLATRELGLTCRSWVVWYYTFGVHCQAKFTRSHAHLFHFVRDPKKFTFNDMAVRVPSARQLVYGDKRANPQGRVPDDTWIIAPHRVDCGLEIDDCRTTPADANISPSEDGIALHGIPPLQGGKEGGPRGGTAGNDGKSPIDDCRSQKG